MSRKSRKRMPRPRLIRENRSTSGFGSRRRFKGGPSDHSIADAGGRIVKVKPTKSGRLTEAGASVSTRSSSINRPALRRQRKQARREARHSKRRHGK